MITAFQIAIERAGWYIGSGWHYLLFAAALLFLILKRDDKENRKWLDDHLRDIANIKKQRISCLFL